MHPICGLQTILVNAANLDARFALNGLSCISGPPDK
jgi:hypothetical protein